MTETRQALLEAGVRLYSTMAGDLLKGLAAGDVAREVGFHRQTFYRYWDTQGEYVNDLLRHVLSPGPSPVADGVAGLDDDGEMDLEVLVSRIVPHDLARVLDDPRIMMRVGLASMRAFDDDPLAIQAQGLVGGALEEMATGYEALLDRVGRRLRPGVRSEDLARAVGGLLLGVVLQQWLAGPDPDSRLLVERATVALIEGLTEPS